jgi:phosphatidylglycerol:prolipoprotein diacylglycerol transferase
MIPVLLRAGPITIYSFGVMMGLGFLFAGVFMQRDFARKGEPPELAWAIVAFAVVGGLVGARLNLVLEHPDAFMRAPLGFLFSQSGFVWYGGLVGGILATLWPIHRAGVRWASAADTAAPALALGLAFGRIGCHLAGDGDWGTPTRLPWGVAYVNGVAPWPWAPGVTVHPAPLYECAALLVLFLVLVGLRTRVERPGTVFAVYLVLAGAIRFAVELVRTNRAVLLGLTEAQWMSAAAMAGGAVWLALRPSGGRRPAVRGAPGPGTRGSGAVES